MWYVRLIKYIDCLSRKIYHKTYQHVVQNAEFCIRINFLAEWKCHRYQEQWHYFSTKSVNMPEIELLHSFWTLMLRIFAFKEEFQDVQPLIIHFQLKLSTFKRCKFTCILNVVMIRPFSSNSSYCPGEWLLTWWYYNWMKDGMWTYFACFSLHPTKLRHLIVCAYNKYFSW